MASAAPGNNIFLLRKCDLDPALYPITHNIVASYSKFYGAFSAVNGNYKEAYIFDNNAFNLNGEPLGQDFFGVNFYNANKYAIRNFNFFSMFHGPEDEIVHGIRC